MVNITEDKTNDRFAIATYGLTKQFDRHIAVNDLELQVDRGEVYGLIGPNGAGKTTLIRMLATAEEPTTGEIYVNGERLLRDDSNPRLKQRLGYLPDDFPLYDDLTVWDYLDYFARLYHLKQPKRRRRLHEVLELVDLTSKRNSQISTLSRGMGAAYALWHGAPPASTARLGAARSAVARAIPSAACRYGQGHEASSYHRDNQSGRRRPDRRPAPVADAAGRTRRACRRRLRR